MEKKTQKTSTRKTATIYKNGKLNTKQEKGFNWLLGYSVKHSTNFAKDQLKIISKLLN